MQLERISLERLQPAPYNPRKTLKPGMPAYERLKRSLTEFELVQPIVWNRATGYIVGGHQRVQILRDQGVTEVECVVVELSPQREKALNVALNNARVAGDWDTAKLVDLVSELQDLPDFDATLTGFDADDLTHLLITPAGWLDPLDETADGDAEGVQVTLDVPGDQWDDVRAALDPLLADFPELRLHVRLPRVRRSRG